MIWNLLGLFEHDSRPDLAPVRSFASWDHRLEDGTAMLADHCQFAGAEELDEFEEVVSCLASLSWRRRFCGKRIAANLMAVFIFTVDAIRMVFVDTT